MSRVIWKYVLEFSGVIKINLPARPTLLDIQFQGDNLCAWVLVDPDAELVPFAFHVYGTGMKISEEYVHLTWIATVQKDGNVWHIFYPNDVYILPTLNKVELG
jgi:hypothetical protein